jgi:hypothetical protein
MSWKSYSLVSVVIKDVIIILLAGLGFDNFSSGQTIVFKYNIKMK